jgi:hypothetical protein
MTIDGRWAMTAGTPGGVQMFSMTIQSDGAKFSGRLSNALGGQDIAGTIEGNVLVWSTTMTEPVALTLDYRVTIDGDDLVGAVVAGQYGSTPLKGTRASAA